MNQRRCRLIESTARSGFVCGTVGSPEAGGEKMGKEVKNWKVKKDENGWSIEEAGMAQIEDTFG